jgi:hypothetical protein
MGVHYYAVYKTPIGVISAHVPRSLLADYTDPTTAFLQKILEIDRTMVNLQSEEHFTPDFGDWVFAQIHPVLDPENAITVPSLSILDCHYILAMSLLTRHFTQEDGNFMPNYYFHEAMKPHFDKVYADTDEDFPEVDLDVNL